VTHGQAAVDLVTQFEGCRLTAYADSGGVLTIGYGHTQGVCPGQTISEEDALLLLNEDLAVADAAVNRLVNVKLAQNQFDALVDFVFNLGEGNLQKSSLLKFLNLGQSLLAAKEFLRWDLIGGVPSAGLLRRRQAEQSLFLTT
jgi:lysozyme